MMDSMKVPDVYQTRMLRMARIRTAAMLLCMVLLFVIGYFALLMGGQLQTILNDAQRTFQSLNTLSTQIEQANIPAMFDNVEMLVQNAQQTMADATGGVDQAIKKIDEVDIDTLNKAIADLAAVVEPIAKLFGGRS